MSILQTAEDILKDVHARIALRGIVDDEQGPVSNLELRHICAALETLLAGIRRHRDQRGDDRCWIDDLELYGLLPEGKSDADLRMCRPEEMLGHCKRFIAARADPTLEYVSPQREIEALKAELLEAKKALAAATELVRDPLIDPTFYVRAAYPGDRTRIGARASKEEDVEIKPIQGIKYEYDTLQTHPLVGDFEENLRDYADDGWRLVCIYGGVAYLERPLLR